MDVWHWKDPRINSQQKKLWNREKDRTYRAVVHVADGRVVRLADLDMPDVETNDNPRYALGLSDVPYLVQDTWGERKRDVYLVSLTDGSRKPVTSALLDDASLAPDGGAIAYFDKGQWRVYDAATGATRDATAPLGVAPRRRAARHAGHAAGLRPRRLARRRLGVPRLRPLRHLAGAGEGRRRR